MDFGKQSGDASLDLEEDTNKALTWSKRPRTIKSFVNNFSLYLMDDTLSIISEAFASPDANH
jgi:hypothetical protein